MRVAITLAALAALFGGTAGPAIAATGDVARGKTLFESRCSLCHSAEPGGEGGMGPSLAGVLGRKAASAPGYPYSKALKASGLTWTPANLDRFLKSPKTVVPGAQMPVATPSDQDRADIVAYLKTTKS